MKVIQMLVALICMAVGVWARIHYRSVVGELRNEQGAYGAFDSSDSAFTYFGTSSDCSNQTGCSTYKPKSAVSSGVQQNVFVK